MAISAVIDRFQQRHSAAGFPLAVLYKYVDDSGGYLAALIAYYGFLSFFPLLLLLSTGLGFVLSGHPALQQEVIGSALHQFPVVGDQLGDPKHLGGGTVGLVIGIAGSIYGGLGVAQAAQYAMNQAWRVPRNERPNPIRARGRSLLLLATAGVAVIGTTVLSTFGSSNAGSFGLALKVSVLLASIVVNAGVFLLAFRIATARDVSVADIAPGAIGAAIGWQLLQTFGVIYVNHAVRNASATNGVFAIVLGLIAFLYLAAVIVVLCVEANVVRVDRLHPRSLLTPFTDNVILTAGDRQAYTDQATAQASKGFQTVVVDFDQEAEN
jgi:membrane protein